MTNNKHKFQIYPHESHLHWAKIWCILHDQQIQCAKIFEHICLKIVGEGKKWYFWVLFWKIWRIQIITYPQTLIQPTYGEFCFNNKVSLHKFSWKYRPKKYLDKKSTFRYFLGNLAHRNKIYPQNPIEPKYGALYLNNKVTVHGLVLLVQLSWKVGYPYI